MTSHTTASPSHYDLQAEHYDAINEERTQELNQTVFNLLQEHGAKKVLDATCGTGSQVFFLEQHGFEVVGSDYSGAMLAQAKSKAKRQTSSVPFHQADIRTLQLGQFDAVISMFNAIGHLTQNDFFTALASIAQSLNPNGVYIFDIFNLTYLLTDNRITELTIDWLEHEGDTTIRKLQYSTVTPQGVLASHTTSITHRGASAPHHQQESQTLQIYARDPIEDMFQNHGMRLHTIVNPDGSPFDETRSERMVVVAQKA